MDIQGWTYLLVGLSFALYIGIAILTRVRSTSGFYVAAQGVPAAFNGMATGADWMSAASFISMAGLISFMGYTGSVYLIGWTGGYVLLALLLAPYLRKFGKFTVPDFVGDRYCSNVARVVAVVCAVFVSFTYVAGQMRGVGVVFSRFLEVNIDAGVLIGMVLVFIYATLGGMKGITYTQVAQYVVLIIAYLIPAVAISFQMTGNPIPQLGFGGKIAGGENAGIYLLEAIDQIHRDLGFPEYTGAFGPGNKSMIDVFAIALALMVGTAGLPHVIIRFYTVKSVRAARWSAFWALLFIGLLYTCAPAVATFARANLIQTLHAKAYSEREEWYKNWERTGLLAWVDKNGDGVIQYGPGAPFVGKPAFELNENDEMVAGDFGEPRLKNELTDNGNELYVDRDIIVLANPEIANLPAWVVALVAAGGLAAALSTAAGLLLVISSSISHDLGKRILNPEMSEKSELTYARIAAGGAIVIAGYFGIHPPGFVAQVVAFAFGLAASSFFPVIILGIFSKRTTREGAVAGMVAGILFTASYIIYFKAISTGATAEDWWLGISPEGIGTVGMVINFAITIVVSRFTPPPPAEVQAQVERLRVPGNG
ncbi:MAG: Cation/acetate symporter ActP [Verrucomicrobia subdivision 3 bacterium]|nr:Cation/acetate symporter ActP [Limisphaerales bacterium]MCS1412929.1 Cation/acetate symporter ActP [Limisphaerales bacterium]